MDGAPPVSSDHLSAPYTERWGLLKDVMTWLYLDQKNKLKLKEIVRVMKEQYHFYASESQYKRQFGLWNLNRAITTAKKKKITKVLETRAQQGKSSAVLHKGKDAGQKLRRHLKEQTRQAMIKRPSISNDAIDIEELSGHALQCGNRVFMNWSMPAAVLRYLKSKAIDHISPYASVRTPMSDIMVITPSSNGGPSPRALLSPSNALSPDKERSSMTVVVNESLKISRALLFAQKHHNNLLKGMSSQEQYITTDWLNQFWQFSFKTARTWGRGPRFWNPSTLGFDEFSKGKSSSPHNVHGMNADFMEQSVYSGSRQDETLDGGDLQKPIDLCRWSIHVKEVYYERLSSPVVAEEDYNSGDEASWRPWTTATSVDDFVKHLQEHFERNDFSTIEAKELPISSVQVADIAKRSPEQRKEEAFGFSIMARNKHLVEKMLEQFPSDREFSFHNLYPLHLAASYLDGSKTCCGIFSELVCSMATGETSVRKLYINHLNHTVLDNLMIAILKAHTSCTPITIDEAFKKEYRFVGEEVDICGRWDADSDCIRHLNASGSPRIPQDWKHMFCHTSAQVITHCIQNLFGPRWSPDINTPSGLFLKRCLNETCGLKLQLKPLHTLVVTSVFLAQLGNDGETLFGIVACLLCLLQMGANPTLKAHVSLNALLSDEDSQQCTHSELDPFELAQKIPQDLISKWPEERKTGWRVFCTILRLAQGEWNPFQRIEPSQIISEPFENDFQSVYSDFMEGLDEQNETTELLAIDIDEPLENNEEDSEDFSTYCDDDRCTERDKFFGKNKCLAPLWAAVQTELLTYRRVSDTDPWISANFDMRSVLDWFKNGDELSIALVSKGMMKSFCDCGTFCDLDDVACLRVEEASAYYFSNLEDYSRTTFLEEEYNREEQWGI